MSEEKRKETDLGGQPLHFQMQPQRELHGQEVYNPGDRLNELAGTTNGRKEEINTSPRRTTYYVHPFDGSSTQGRLW